MSRAQHTMSDEAAVLKAIGHIREGRRVRVDFLQKGLTVAVVCGRWVPSDPPTRIGWRVCGYSGSLACILPTDRIILCPDKRGMMHLRVDLAGSRMPLTAPAIRRARLAGMIPETIKDKPAAGGVS